MKKIAFIISFFAMLLPLWSAAKSDAPFNEVDGTNNWNYNIDISESEEGTYNFIIKATDSAGNETLVGPHNFQVDPNSDLPVAAFSYPSTGSRAGSIINIVGTAYDDDAVGQVEIKVDDGPWRRAEGREFWSYLLVTEDIPDGEHTLTVRPHDMFGVTGNEVSVNFILDKEAPANQVDSHTNGVLLSGRNTITGTLTDANGIAALDLSRDEGESYESIRFSYDKKTEIYNFDFTFDSRDMEDGSYVFWLRSRDTTGSEGTLPFQFYVDNQGPELTLTTPNPEEMYSGVVGMSGMVNDQIGVRSLSFTSPIHKEPVEIPLIQGNPFWSYNVNFSEIRGDKVDVTFLLEDLTGNQATYRERIQLNEEGDLPVLSLYNQDEQTYQSSTIELFGVVEDDDAPGLIRYSLDRGEPVELQIDRVFRITLNDLNAGEHRIELTPVDNYGTEGEELEYSFTVAQAAPILGFENYLVGEELRQWYPGIELDPQQNATISGFVLSEEKPVLTLEQTLPDGTTLEAASVSLKTTEEPGRWSFSLTVKKDSLPGLYHYSLRVEDNYGQSCQNATAFYVMEKILGEDGKTVEGLRNPAPNGVFLTRVETDDQGYYWIQEGMPLMGWVKGGDVRSVSLNEENDILSLSNQGNSFSLSYRNAGYLESVVLSVEAAGGVEGDITSLNLRTDSQGPGLDQWNDHTWEAGQDFWKSGEIQISGRFRDNSGIESVSYALNDGTFRSLSRASLMAPPVEDLVPNDEETAATAEETAVERAPIEEEIDPAVFNFEDTISLGGVEEGFFVLHVRSMDEAGNESTYSYPYYKDSTAPGLRDLTPGAESEVIRETTLAFLLDEMEDLLRAEFSTDGENWEALEIQDNLISKVISLSDYPVELTTEGLQFRLTDRSGNQSIHSPSFIINREADKPTLNIQAPLEWGTVRTDFAVSGYVTDNDSIDAILYRVNGEGDFIETQGGNTFSIDIMADSLAEGDHFIEMQARDRGGILSDVMLRNIRVSHNEPESTVSFPLVEDVVEGIIDIQGTSSDLNGIDSVYISLNNGRNFNLVEGTEEWHYQVDTRILEEGTHSFLVKAVDGAGTEGVFVSLVNIDNQSPEIELDFPAEGSSFFTNIQVEGRAEDANLTSLILKVEQNGAILEERELELTRVIKEEIRTEEYAPGTYTIRIESTDMAGNNSYVSRIVQKPEEADNREVLISYPRMGSEQGPRFLLEGHLIGVSNPGNVALYLNEALFDTVEVAPSGWFSRVVEPEEIPMGELVFEAVYEDSDGQIRSGLWPITVVDNGGWLTLDSIRSGEFVRERPWISGTIGYESVALELEGDPESKENQKLLKDWEKINESMLDAEILVSLDNGRSFESAQLRGDQWRYRLETMYLNDGQVPFLVEARFPDGTTRVMESLLQFDKQYPELRLLNDEVVDGAYNGNLELIGTASDSNGLSDLSVIVREGDKKSYSTPAFIQGLYLDIHGLGVTWFDIGLGLTFFDDNVKLQAQFGLAPESYYNESYNSYIAARFSGYVMGGKLIANVAKFPFGYYFGPDWDWLEASIALGANFSYFTMQDSISFSGGKVLGGIVGQLEFPKVTFEDNEYLQYVSLYTEGQLWFIPSDTDPSIEPQIGFGVRVGMF